MRTRSSRFLVGLACLGAILGLLMWSRNSRVRTETRKVSTTATPKADGKASLSSGGKVSSGEKPRRLHGTDPAWQIPEGTATPTKVLTEVEVLTKGKVLVPVGKSSTQIAATTGAGATEVKTGRGGGPDPSGGPDLGGSAGGSIVGGGSGGAAAPRVVTTATNADATDERQRSIQAAVWKGKANQLVSALRAGKGVDIDHAQVMEFLHGRDLQGWSPDNRNWIGDELMIVLVHDLPERAFADLKSVQENPAAPAAMRDYSVQHIGDLVINGTIDQGGVDYIWKTLAQNDPVTVSTALIMLHRLSEQKPELVPASRVAEAAQNLLASADERTQITAKSILRQ